MSTGAGFTRRTLYFGPPTGFYEPNRFDTFVKNQVKTNLRCSDTLNLEGDMPNITYHFPDSCIGLRYSLVVKGRVAVDLVGTQRGTANMDIIQKLIFEKDNV